MPTHPGTDPNRRIDPRRQGDHRSIQHPENRNGNRIGEKPWTDRYGRHIPPGYNHSAYMRRPAVINNIRNIHNHWNRNDHGYRWHNWHGRHLCHHYDHHGFHWWGFYVDNHYFWTRWHNDRYWWYDPYWHRWCYMHDDRWWWQGDDGIAYVYINGRYYRYGRSGGGVIIVPDQTSPVEPPPTDPNEPGQPEQTPTFYSLDGARSVQILGDRKEAYLYDLTAREQDEGRAKGRYLASGVKDVKFVSEKAPETDGSAEPVLRQIELSFDDPKLGSAVADVNGERRVQLEGEEKAAYLFNLEKNDVEPVFLAGGVNEILMINKDERVGDDVVRRLQMISLKLTDESGKEDVFLYDRDGNPSKPPALGATPKVLEQNIHDSPAFRDLQSDPWVGWRN